MLALLLLSIACRAVDPATCFQDEDGDGHGDPDVPADVDADECRDGLAPEGDDCSDVNATRHPGADEICGNGIDEDCDGDPGVCPPPKVAVPDLVLAGDPWSGFAGAALAALGDVDGDGFEDFVVGAPNWDSSRGRAYVVMGGPDLSGSLPDRAAAVLEGESGDESPNPLGNAGDIDGDGVAEFLAGARENDGAESNGFGGAVYMIPGDITGTMDLSEAASAVFLGARSDHISLATGAGDLTGDGVPDVLVGAPWHRQDELQLGCVYLVSGAEASGNVPLQDVTRFVGVPSSVIRSYAGYAVAADRDFDGDGLADFLVSDPSFDESGAIYLVTSPVSGIHSLEDSVTISGRSDSAGFGMTLASLGDADGDGYEDAVTCNTSRTSVFAGPIRSGTSKSAQTELDGPCYALTDSGPGDFDGDGAADLLVGSHEDDGVARLMYGPLPFGSFDIAEAANVRFQGEPGEGTTPLYFGSSLAFADIDGDGVDDVIAGAYGYDREEGSVQMFFGAAR